MFELVLSTHAADFFQAADAPLQRKLDRAFDQLRTNPRRHNNIKGLTGKFAGRFRYRVGDWRVIYMIDEAHHRVFVADVAHRREIYD